MAARACWRNAQQTALGWTAAPTGRYAEGWALVPSDVYAEGGQVWVPHGWNVDEAGHALDRTLVPPALRYVGEVVAVAEITQAWRERVAEDGRGYWGGIRPLPLPPGPNALD